MKAALFPLLFLLFVVTPPLTVGAHTTGLSYETAANGHLIDIGYDPAVPVAGERLVLDFSMRDPKTKDLQKFADVWVRVESGGELLIATGVAQAAFGPTTLLLELPKEAGPTVKISLRFENADSALAETSFELPVQRAPGAMSLWEAVLGFSAGVLLTGLIARFGVVSWVYERFFAVSRV